MFNLQIVKLNNKKRHIVYTMISTPLPTKEYVASFSLTKTSEESFEVIFIAKFKVQQTNPDERIDAFNKLQLELLVNLNSETNDQR